MKPQTVLRFHREHVFNEDGLVADGVGARSGAGDCCNATHAPKCRNNGLPGYSYNQVRACVVSMGPSAAPPHHRAAKVVSEGGVSGSQPKHITAVKAHQACGCTRQKPPNLPPLQGLYLSAAAHLYAITNSSRYLVHASKLVEAVLQNATDARGILIEPPAPPISWYGGQCLQGADPGGDWYSFKGIAVMHLTYFVEKAGRAALSSSQLRRLQAMVHASSDGAWFNASFAGHHARDVCDSTPVDVASEGSVGWGTAANVAPSDVSTAFRRFHWRWDYSFNNNSNGSHVVPPADTEEWFTQGGVRCTGLADIGMTHSETNCRAHCAADHLCAAYNFAPVSKTGIGTGDCWLMHGRTDKHECATVDANFRLGVKRPAADGKCASSSCGGPPQNTSD